MTRSVTTAIVRRSALVVLLALPFCAIAQPLNGTNAIRGTTPSYGSFAAAVSALTVLVAGLGGIVSSYPL
jgi:hypothetical protein